MDKIGKISMVSEYWVCYKLLKLVGQDYTDYSAYKLGLIDDEGKVIKKAKTKEEKMAMRPLVVLALNIKKTAKFNPKFYSKLKLSPLIALRESFNEYNDFEDDIIIEAMVSGDAGDTPTDVAAGVNTGSVIGSPSTLKKETKKKKKKK